MTAAIQIHLGTSATPTHLGTSATPTHLVIIVVTTHLGTSATPTHLVTAAAPTHLVTAATPIPLKIAASIHIKFGTSSTVKSYCSYNIVENANQYIYIDVTGTTTSNSPYRNVKICQGVNNTTTYKTITDSNVGQTFQTVYQPASSQTINI